MKKINIIKKLLLQLSYEEFQVKKCFFLNTGKIDEDLAEEIDRQYKKKEYRDRKRWEIMELESYLSQYDYSSAQAIYNNKLKNIEIELYTKLKEKYQYKEKILLLFADLKIKESTSFYAKHEESIDHAFFLTEKKKAISKCKKNVTLLLSDLKIEEADNFYGAYKDYIDIDYYSSEKKKSIEVCKKELSSFFFEHKIQEAEDLYEKFSPYIDATYYSGLKLLYDLSILSSRIKSNFQKSNNCYDLIRGDLTSPKREQYALKMKEAKGDKWTECNIWLYMASEYVVEKWAKENNVECFDYNEIDMYHKRDYSLDGIDIDVKTTMGIGSRQLPKYNNVNDITEILIGVGSNIKCRDAQQSSHTIHGIYDKKMYSNINIELHYYTHSTNYLNVCYFSSLEEYFKIDKNIDGLDISGKGNVYKQYLVKNENLDAIFLSVNPKLLPELLGKLLPICHHDFIPVILELKSKNKLFLLPHFLTDYLLQKILNKEKINNNSITKIIYSIYMPSTPQQKYISSLLKVREAMALVRCVDHPNETIEHMGIEIYSGAKPTLRACCSQNQKIKTTFYTYSWKTGETLVFGDNDIELCDDKGCGCLTHLHHQKKIGKRSCKKYGQNPSYQDEDIYAF